MKAHDIAVLFDQVADALEFRDENVFRIRAYRRAAQSLDALSDDLDRMNAEGRLTEIPGVGQGLAAQIREFLATGAVKEIDELKLQIPAGLFEMLAVPGLGPKTAKVLHQRLRISNIKQLEAAAKTHKICKLPGFQETKEQNLLKGIEIIKKGRERIHLGLAFPLVRSVLDMLRSVPVADRVETAGSLRRMKETIGDLDILVSSRRSQKIMEAFTASRFCARILASGETKSSILTPEGFQIDLRVVEPESFGAALQYFTGSKEHNVKLRELAIRKGLKINEYGVFNAKTEKRLAGREEADVYKALGLPWIPPEIREDQGEIEAAVEGRLPKLVEMDDLKGDFHIHTNESDGTNTLEQLAVEGVKRGYEYMAICDHSKSLRVANGLSEERLAAHLKRIKALNSKLSGLRLLTGSEVDILKDGSMDYDDATLKQMDFVIGSIHTGFTQDEATITRRITTAMRNPYVTMIAHPTGRLLGQREPYAVDLDAVFQAAKATRTALEINSYPQRLDLRDTAARLAKDAGVTIGLSTDTHQLSHLDNISLGLSVARRAWLEPKHILNCMSRDQLLAWIQQKRRRHG